MVCSENIMTRKESDEPHSDALRRVANKGRSLVRGIRLVYIGQPSRTPELANPSDPCPVRTVLTGLSFAGDQFQYRLGIGGGR
jgi:hypothetical protein